MKRKIGYKETSLGTSFIILIVYLLSLIDLNLEILNPIQKAFNDFSLTDIYYSHIKESPPHNDDIVLVNVGFLPREGIAELIEIVNEDQPKVIGMDVFFRDLKPENPLGDSALIRAFSKVSNLVLVSKLYGNEEEKKIDSITYSHPFFTRYAKSGFANLHTKGEDHFMVARYYIPKEIYNGQLQRSFAVELVHQFDPVLADKFLARNNELEEINYQGNIHFGENASENEKIVCTALDWDQVLERNFEPGTFKNKIVMLGFMGGRFGDGSMIDKFFTPLNPDYIGKASYDMYGVTVHANVVGMILQESYINTMPVFIDYILALIFIFLNVWLFAWMYYNLQEWFDGASLLVTLIEVLLLMAIQIFIFAFYEYKFDITLPVVALLLMGNMVEIYFGIIHTGGVKVLRRKRIFVKH